MSDKLWNARTRSDCFLLWVLHIVMASYSIRVGDKNGILILFDALLLDNLDCSCARTGSVLLFGNI